MIRIKLNPEEYRLLRKEILPDIKSNQFFVDKDNIHWLIFESKDFASIFDRITDYLTINGFNLDYSINPTGRILENLVDKFNAI